MKPYKMNLSSRSIDAKVYADESLLDGRQGLRRNEDTHSAKAGICKHLYINTLEGRSLVIPKMPYAVKVTSYNLIKQEKMM